MALFAAFIAASAWLLHAGAQAGAGMLEKNKALSARLEAEGSCFELDFFSSDAGNAEKLRESGGEISAVEKTIVVNGTGARCISRVGRAGTMIEVERNNAEAR